MGLYKGFKETWNLEKKYPYLVNLVLTYLLHFFLCVCFQSEQVLILVTFIYVSLSHAIIPKGEVEGNEHTSTSLQSSEVNWRVCVLPIHCNKSSESSWVSVWWESPVVISG